jgi:hypothetical protein
MQVKNDIESIFFMLRYIKNIAKDSVEAAFVKRRGESVLFYSTIDIHFFFRCCIFRNHTANPYNNE